MAKNLDWPFGDGYVFINKRNVVKEAFGSDSAAPLRWTSKYGSITFNQFGREFPLGGINEAGLVIEELSSLADYPLPDMRASLNELQWIQYHLDNHSSVKKVLESERRLRISKFLFNLHYLVADRKGNAAVIEFVKGTMASYTGESLPVRVLSNNSYSESLRYLKSHKGFGGQRIVSNGQESSERFVRAATLLEDYDSPVQRPWVDDAFVILKSVAQNDTQWSLVYNIAKRAVLFKTKVSRRLKIINLADFDLDCTGPALMLPVLTDAAGNLSRRFAAYNPQKNWRLLDSVFHQLKELGELARAPQDDAIRKISRYPDTCRCR